MYNKAILIGRLGQDPEMRYTPSGMAVTNFSIATDRKWRDKSGNLQDETTWHDIVCWGKQAEFVGEYCSKGRLVFVEGEIKKRSWQDKNGVTRVNVEINARIVQLLDSKGRAGAGGEKPPKDKDVEEKKSNNYDDQSTIDTEDDVPF
ncbi:single-stranded DNA-binding protein [bacterium]|nr:single-stranded DNA-binding protein [bacterium]